MDDPLHKVAPARTTHITHITHTTYPLSDPTSIPIHPFLPYPTPGPPLSQVYVTTQPLEGLPITHSPLPLGRSLTPPFHRST